MKKVNFLIFLNLTLSIVNSHAMQGWRDWIRGNVETQLQNIGLTQPKLTPTEELKQIVEREGTFKNVDIKKIKELIALQADVNVVGKDGKTPLFLAITDNNPELVRLFAEFVKADINKQYGAEGFTPLAIAAYEGRVQLIPILLRFGARIDTRDNQRNTPLMLAARVADQNDSVAVSKALLNAGIDINAQNNAGETALARAVQRKNYPLIEFLSTQGADKTLKNNQGKTPLDLAQANNDQEAINLLEKKKLL
ncbi:MAG: hypothetical protein AMXMBFR12_05890 [Candidatus Babeliales bacterium]